ncbi:hypothetical protein OG594_08800 [Streptomyces sp. NBC_01214]|uniref:hypothetical protein n=1 Tax=Streptomyces sp. NBC_01214 TaxID=2903777 RepID=UPI00225B3C70|nr:hypothetical protein [Streptomyces sp. NBC_01214]MCX4801748.1 hypothetical protein [Streptomyces sp. NBC_01214]
MTGQLELWSPGWEVEPCGHNDPDPDEQAHADLHAVRHIPGDHGRPAGRGTYSRLRRIQTIKPAEVYL